jgi:hypothetical protein
MLQRLIRRELPRFVEATHIQIKGMSILEAPSDLDGVSNIRWLPLLHNGAKNGVDVAWNTGVFNTLLEPVSVIEVGVVVEHGAVPINCLRVALPIVKLNIDSGALRRVTKVASAMSTLPIKSSEDKCVDQAKLVGKTDDATLSPSSGDLVAGEGIDHYHHGTDMDEDEEDGPIKRAWWMKQKAQWKLNNLKRLLRSLKLLQCHDMPQQQQQRQQIDAVSLSTWIASTKKHIERACVSLSAATITLTQLVEDTKRMLQVQPHMHLVAFIGGVRVGLITTRREPIATLSLDRISAIFANVRKKYQDSEYYYYYYYYYY